MGPVMTPKARACIVLFSLITILASGLTAIAQSSLPSGFLTVSGTVFSYKGQVVYLHGENFSNAPALGAGFGNGDITNLNVAEADYAQLSALGANHVRFGMSYLWYQTNRTQFFQVLDQHIAWAKLHHIWLILLMFATPSDCYEGWVKTCGIWTNPTEQTTLTNFWTDVSAHYKNEPTVISYDL